MKKAMNYLVAIAILASSSSAFALFGGGGGFGGVVFDPTNYGRNAITALQSVRDEINQLSQIEQQIKGNIAQFRDVGNLGEALNRVTALNQSAKILEQKMGNAQSVFNNAQAMYGAGQFRSWNEFGQAIQQRASTGETAAFSLVRSAEIANRQITEANTAHQKIAGTMNGVQGATEAAQTTTAAVNILIDQNNALLGLMSAKNTEEGRTTAQKTAREAAAQTAAKNFGEQSDAEWRAFKQRTGL